VEFVEASELKDILEDIGLEELPPENDCTFLNLTGDDVVRHHLAAEGSDITPLDGATSHTVPVDRLHLIFEGIVHRLHLDQVVVVPAAPWSHLFDGIAFGLAENEEWQEFDAAATVERNSRDPLLVLPAEFPTLVEVVRTMFSDCDELTQSVMMLAPGVPLLVTLLAGGAVRVDCGTPVIADEVTSLFDDR
jgi:hypothetical protein